MKILKSLNMTNGKWVNEKSWGYNTLELNN